MAQKIRFTKMHGCGNDYIYINMVEQSVAEPQTAAIQWSNRYKGIGSDGLVLIDKSPVPEADFSMRIFNADGSEAMMCGNASRCIGKYLYERGLTPKTQIRLLTLSGIKVLDLHLTPEGIVDTVTVDMGEPVLEDESLFLGNRVLDKGTFVSMGNPHYVVFTENVDQVGETGRMLERHPAFPQRCNIEFARIVSGKTAGHTTAKLTTAGHTTAKLTTAKNMTDGNTTAGDTTTIRTRVWERGSGITQACGTGACATAVAAVLTGRAGRKSDIVMDGGTLNIEWRESDNHVYMTGPAEFVFDGEIEWK